MKWFPRENYLSKIRGFYHATDIIKVITGVRRSGKSCLMETVAEELCAEGVAKGNIIYIDLDDQQYENVTTVEQLKELIASIDAPAGTKYLFIDEVQNVSGFETILNGLRNTGEWSVFITGSNSYLLSGELMTKLTGRYIEFEIYPLSFEEYLQIKKYYKLEVNIDTTAELNNYILEGGFPRAVFMDNLADKRRYALSVIEEIFEKDIRRRVRIRNKSTFETVRTFVINNFGSTFSLKGLCKALKNAGTPISEATAARYVKALLDAKIMYDTAKKTGNYGPVLENITYIYARSHDYSASVGRIGKLECDFILRDFEMQYYYVQVAYTIALSKETEDREYRPLEMIRDNYPKYVLTLDPLLQRRNGVKHANLAEFMKNGESF